MRFCSHPWIASGGLLILAVVGISLFIPPYEKGIVEARKLSCANNLRQLYELGKVYASTHQGKWPDATGSGLWLSFTRTTPPLIEPQELEVLLCPVRGEVDLGRCDYLGPRKPVSELKPGDALSACRRGNHDQSKSGNVLLKDGSVQDYEYSHPIWDTLAP